jgi:large subunit ribosomal protein L22
MSVKAIVKSVRVSPRKVDEVVSLVRGRSVEDALVILEHTPRRAALPVSKVINSAASNAENNHGYQRDGLKIISITVGPGLVMKRYRPAAHGRAQPYRKRTSIIAVEVDGKKKAPKKPKNTAAKKKANENSDKSAKESK